MNQYERIVSYIYQYEQGEKGANTGFAKVEKRGNQCRISVQIRTTALPELPKVYLYQQHPEGIRTIPVGTMLFRGNNLLWKGSCEADKLFGTVQSIDDIDGIFIDVSEKLYFATSWKRDQFYRGSWKKDSMIVERKSERQDTSLASLGGQPTSQLMEEAAKQTASAIKEREDRQHLDSAIKEREGRQQPETILKEGQQSIDASEVLLQPENLIKEKKVQQSLEKSMVAGGDVQQPEPVEKKGEEEQELVSASLSAAALEQPELQEERPLGEQKLQDMQMQSICGVCPFKRKKYDYGKKILLTFPSMKPFETNVARACVRMELQDIGCLPIASWSLSGNRFLLHGYYCYRHLLFAQMADGRYALGVPGIYSEKDRRNALKFGFTDFQSIGEFGQQQGAFGYWLLELPDAD